MPQSPTFVFILDFFHSDGNHNYTDYNCVLIEKIGSYTNAHVAPYISLAGYA